MILEGNRKTDEVAKTAADISSSGRGVDVYLAGTHLLNGLVKEVKEDEVLIEDET